MINISTFVCNPFQEQCYVLWQDDSSSCLVVDPGCCNDFEWDLIHQHLQQHGLVPEAVLVTHSHCDHVMGTGYVRRDYPNVVIYGSEEDQNHLPPVYLQNRMFGVETDIHHDPITHNLSEGDELLWPIEPAPMQAQHRIRVIDCPGHSHHGLCYYFPDDQLLLSGDVLFCHSVGRADFGSAMGCNQQLLLEGIAQKLFTLPADVVVYPGHGPKTTIGEENLCNPYI